MIHVYFQFYCRSNQLSAANQEIQINKTFNFHGWITLVFSKQEKIDICFPAATKSTTVWASTLSFYKHVHALLKKEDLQSGICLITQIIGSLYFQVFKEFIFSLGWEIWIGFLQCPIQGWQTCLGHYLGVIVSYYAQSRHGKHLCLGRH